MHTTTGLRFLRALADRGEAIPTYLERLEPGPHPEHDARRDTAEDEEQTATLAG
jgi:hypothetical protein